MGIVTSSTVAYSPIQPIHVVRGRWHGWPTSTIIHLLPLASTIALLYINFAGLFWFPTTGVDVLGHHVPASNILNMLQLAAKLYEILVVISLTAIALKTYKRRLIQDGIPLGLLTGAYRVFDVLYVFSPTFWSGAKRAMSLASLLIISVILCALAAPASAILIVPNLGWFKMPRSFSNVYMPVSLQRTAWLRPTVFDGSLGETQTYCLTRAGAFIEDCPAAGFQNIFTWATGWKYTGLPDNITFQDPSGTVTRRLDMESTNLGTFVTTLMVNAVSTFGQFKKYINTQDVGKISYVDQYRLSLTEQSSTFQPLVNTRCNVWNLQNYDNVTEIPTFVFPSEELNCFTTGPDNECTRLRKKYSNVTVPSDVWQGQENMTYKFNTISGESAIHTNTSKPDPSFLAFSARLPYAFNQSYFGTRVAACSIMSHWIPSLLWADSSGSDLVHSNITDLASFGYDEKFRREHDNGTIGSLIRFDQSWLPYLNIHAENGLPVQNATPPVVPVTDITFEEFPVFGALLSGLSAHSTNGDMVFGPGSALYTNPGSIDPRDDAKVQLALEKLIGTLVADAIAHVQAGVGAKIMRPNGEGNRSAIIDTLSTRDIPGGSEILLYKNGTFVYPGGQTDNTNKTLDEWMDYWLEENVNMFFKAEQYGYGYGQSRGPLIFAIVVVLVYLVVLASYMAAAIFHTSDAIVTWSDVQDMVVLAWISPRPDGLQSKGVNTEGGDIWSENVSVRATASNHVNLALDEQDSGLLRLRRNERYW